MGRHKKQPDPNHMTPKQQAVFDYIKQCVLERNYPPSVRDICAAVGLKSTSSVFTYINDLGDILRAGDRRDSTGRYRGSRSSVTGRREHL